MYDILLIRDARIVKKAGFRIPDQIRILNQTVFRNKVSSLVLGFTSVLSRIVIAMPDRE